ncbi:protamine-like [Musca domestica]|uniref:Protamine-like n=1 Tax=Musca domestica TaxID=7370 RepID=A0A1I8MSR1_MUSDO|nr:protamine-like [Musca domestica]
MSCRMVCTGEGATTTTSGGKCMRPGPMTRNGYLNFLREYRQKHCGLTAVETVRQGAFAWNKLSQEEKNRYKKMASAVSSRPRRSAFAPRRMRRSASSRSRRSARRTTMAAGRTSRRRQRRAAKRRRN